MRPLRVTYKEHVVRGNVRSEHVVQLFDSIESRTDAVSTFLAAAYEAGDNLLVVAKPKHWEGIAQRLSEQGCDIATDLKSGRITVLDAATTLRAVSRNDVPDQNLFNHVIAKVIRTLTAHGGLAIYGEMVELLAEEANFTAALQLEELWNAQAERTSFRLMCGYSSIHFAALPTDDKLLQVFREHTHIMTRASDPLGVWLVQRTRLPSKAEPLPTRS